MTLFSKIC